MSSGGSTRSTQEASYPAEFRPLAEAAREQILQMQRQNNLWQYANPMPGATAGLSPFQQATMGAIPSLALPNPAMEQMGKLVGPVAGASMYMGQAGEVTPAAQTALASLSRRLGGGQTTFDPLRQSQFTNYINAGGANSLPQSYSTTGQTVFPGLGSQFVTDPNARAQLMGPTPTYYFDRATGQLVLTPPPSLPFVQPPGPAPTPETGYPGYPNSGSGAGPTGTESGF